MSFIENRKAVNVVNALGGSRYAVILEDNRNMYKYIVNYINSTLDRLPRPDRIKINDLCLAMYDDDNWHRAKVTNLKPLTVWFLDFANEAICNFDLIKAIPKDLARIPPLAIIIQTEDYVTLEEGSLVNVSVLDEIEHGYLKVVVLKEKDRNPANSSKRLEIVADPQHVEKFTKKKKSEPEKKIEERIPPLMQPRTSPLIQPSKPPPQPFKPKQVSNDVTMLDDDDSDVEFVTEFRKKPKKRMGMKIDTTSLVYTALSNPPYTEQTKLPTPPKPVKDMPKNLTKRISVVSKSLGMLSMRERKWEFKVDGLVVPIRDHIFDSLKPRDVCIVIIHDSLSDEEYTGMVICKRLEHEIGILDKLEELDLDRSNPYEAKRGNLVAVYLDPMNQWYRAYVVHERTPIDPFYLVVLVDVGLTYRTMEVFSLPERFHLAPTLAFRLCIKSFPKTPDSLLRLEVLPITKALIEGDTYQHDKCIYKGEITKVNDENFEGQLWSTLRPPCRVRDDSYHVEFSPWLPTREEIGIKAVSVSDGDLVKISAIPTTNECYVVPVDEDLNERRNQFLDNVVLHCQKAPTIAYAPKLREIIAVPHLNSYWRGQIFEKKKHSYIVHLLDLGSKVKILKDEIKPLPDRMKYVDCFAVGVILDKIQRTDFNKGAEDFLKFIVTHEKEFVLKVKESRTVELKFAEDAESRRWRFRKDESFNDRLEQILTPLWKMSEHYDFGALYFLSKLRYEEWEIGTELSLYFVECLDEKNGIMINRFGEVYAKLVEVNLIDRLKEYAEDLCEKYVPIRDELCVAKYDDGQWYRAVCCLAEPGKDLELQFIDIGFRRTVSHKNIRRIHPDFLKHPAAALLCEVANYKECKCFAKLEGQVLRKCKVLKKIEEGGYSLEIADLASYT